MAMPPKTCIDDIEIQLHYQFLVTFYLWIDRSQDAIGQVWARSNIDCGGHHLTNVGRA